MFDRLLPDHYLTPLKSPGPGYEVFQMLAKVGERYSLSVERFASAAFILSAAGGAFATGSVELYRAAPHPDGISVTVKAGTIVKSSRGGRRYLTTADVLFGPTDLGPFLVGVKAEAQGYEYNEPGILVTPSGISLEGEIDTIDVLVEQSPSQPLANTGTATVTFGAPSGVNQLVSSMTGASFSPDSVGRFVTFTGAANAANDGNKPIVQYVSAESVWVQNALGVAEVSTPSVNWQEYSAATDLGDLTIQVRQPQPTSGGQDASLDAHGKDRNILRGVGEADDSYKGRIRALPDNISPNAVDRALQQLLFPYGQTYQFIETFDIAYQTCWDAPRDPIPGSNYDPNLFVYDDPDADAVPFRNRWLDLNDMRGAFVVVVPLFTPIRDQGMCFDSTETTSGDLVGPIGTRACNAFDVPSNLGFGWIQGAWDGFDQPVRTIYKTTYDTLQGIKAAGAHVAVELQGE